MINIKDKKVLITGDIYELIDDLQALITLITIREVDSKHYKKEMCGIMGEEAQNLLTTDSLLRMIYTACSVEKKTFYKLLEIEQQIMIEIATGKFDLIYRDDEGESDEGKNNN